jgi:cyclophilin family peptidyl-prolyl cis-trans isomerase
MMSKRPHYFLIILLLVAGVLVSACDRRPAVEDLDEPEWEERADIKHGVQPLADNQVAVIETEDFGAIVIELYPNLAPQMVERFKRLIQEGFYNTTTFHRVNPSLIQGGDPLTKDNDPTNDGSGNSPYPNVPGEFSNIPFEAGSVGAARLGATLAVGGQPALTEEQARNTNNCQFFITLGPVPEFDEDYTLFGKVISGLNNVRIIAGVPVADDGERPLDKVLVKTITLRPRSSFVSK